MQNRDASSVSLKTDQTSRLLDELSRTSQEKLYKPGEVIHDTQTPADRLFVIRQGEVRIFHIGSSNSTRLVEILGPGDWLGIATLAQAVKFDKRAVAVSAVVVTEIKSSEFLSALAKDPIAAIELMHHLAARLHEATKEATGLVYDDCESRVVKTLVDFSQSPAASLMEDNSVTLRITHQQLAQAIGVARETVSLTLTKLRHRDLVKTGRNRLIFSPAHLRDFAKGEAEVVD